MSIFRIAPSSEPNRRLFSSIEPSPPFYSSPETSFGGSQGGGSGGSSKPLATVLGKWMLGNWKMNHGAEATTRFFVDLKRICQERQPECREIKLAFANFSLHSAIFPSAPFLEHTAATLQRLSEFPIHIGSQNTHEAKQGAFTGEISVPMLKELGIHRSLVGHSERRQFFGETDAVVRRKVESLLSQDVQVICCIGESAQERKDGRTQDVLTRQLEAVLGAQDPSNPKAGAGAFLDSRLVFAYEPIWAIGTGVTATPEQAQEAHQFIRQEISRLASSSAAKATPILYGGSVTPENVQALLRCPDVNGGLVGGASLKADLFFELLLQGARA